ncbi:Ku protein [Streptomyces sp. NPDC059637]|uniref:non-homologous end joining protein Ku n=1 Tax=Streptomyces sp. NPDC059637 TaxID=3347752 RepID=UPI0036861016
MRTVWKGSILFGLVSIPVQLVPATEEQGVRFHQVHAKDGSPIRYRRVCEEEGKEVPRSEIAKGYRTSDGRVVVLEEEDWESLPLPDKDAVEVVAFVDEGDVDPVLLARAYYARPDAPASRPYALLARALARSHRAAIARMALRNRETLALLRARDGVLVLHTMLWPDELRPPDGVVPDTSVAVRPKDLRLADALMDQLGGVEIGELTDTYRKAVEDLVATKVWGAGTPGRAPGGRARQKAEGLTDALERSLAEAGAGARRRTPRKAAESARRAAPAERGAVRTGTAARRSTTGKAAAKKKTAAAKKETAAGRSRTTS